MPAIAQAPPVRIGLMTIKTGSQAEGGIRMEQGITTVLILGPLACCRNPW